MKVRSFLFLGFLAALAAFGAVQLWSLRATFLNNRVVYLMHQQKWKEAQEQLSQASEVDPQNPRSRFLMARLAMHLGHHEQAQRLLGQLAPTAQVEYNLGVNAYEQNDQAQALAHFRNALAAKDATLPAALVELTRAAVQQLSSGSMPQEQLDLDQQQAVERMIGSSLKGRELFARGRYEQAREQLEQALELNDSNRRTRELACATNAILGNFDQAQMFADYAPTSASLYRHMVKELTSISEQSTTNAVSMDEALRSFDVQHRLRTAIAWGKTQLAAAKPTSKTIAEARISINDLASRAPYDLRLQLMQARFLEQLEQLPEAYRHYRALFVRQPNYSVLLRLQELAGESWPELKDASAQLLSAPQVVACVRAEQMESSETLLRRNYLAFLQNAGTRIEVPIAAAGEYDLDLVARGDRAFGLSPLVSVHIDGKSAGKIYVAREGWDCYSMRTFLTVGTHTVQIEYINDSERLLSPEEDRNFYLQALIVSGAGTR